jgi:hypothetical protein
MAREVVPVYSRNATSSKEKPLYHVSRVEALDLIDLGTAKRVSARKAPLKIQLIQLVTPDVNSPAAISFQEIQANAGICGTAGYIRRVREKVANWNSCGEGRLVCS